MLPLPGLRHTVVWLVPFFPEKQSHACMVFRFCIIQPRCTSLLTVDERLFVGTCSILSLERQYTLFQIYSRKGNDLSQCNPRDPYTIFCAFLGDSSPPVKLEHFQILWAWPPLAACKKPELFSSPSSPVYGPRDFLPDTALFQPLCPTLLLSLLSPPRKGSLPI